LIVGEHAVVGQLREVMVVQVEGDMLGAFAVDAFVVAFADSDRSREGARWTGDLSSARTSKTTRRRSSKPAASPANTSASSHRIRRCWIVTPRTMALERRFGDLPASVLAYDRRLTTVQNGEYKLIRGADGSEALYRIADDPMETTDLAAERRGAVRLLGDVLDDWRDSVESAPASGSVSMTQDTEERLADLGYLQ
jgi:hypothetical protein